MGCEAGCVDASFGRGGWGCEGVGGWVGAPPIDLEDLGSRSLPSAADGNNVSTDSSVPAE